MQKYCAGQGQTIGKALKHASLLRILKVVITEWLEIKPTDAITFFLTNKFKKADRNFRNTERLFITFNLPVCLFPDDS